MKKFKTSNYIINKKKEEYLAFLHGQRLSNLPHLTKKNTKVKNVFLCLLKLAYFILKNSTIKNQTLTCKKQDFLFFYDTPNQKLTLSSTAANLHQRNSKTLTLSGSGFTTSPTGLRLRFSLEDILLGIALLITNGPKLYLRLVNENPEKAKFHFDKFAKTYFYIPYFLRTLSRINPTIVISANDHNVSNQCLLAVSKELNIKSAYLQHASVSSLFPPLDYDYAFLDGMRALETYRTCAKNNISRINTAKNPRIFLTGQKKQINSKKHRERHPTRIGIATTKTDSPDSALNLVKFLVENDINVHFRWHPGHDQKTKNMFKNALISLPNVTSSNPLEENLEDFFLKITHLIAANSSIHLEAVICRVIPIYYELSPPIIPDYYKYVYNGIAIQAKTKENIVEMIKNHTSLENSLNIDAIKAYSSTFGSSWEGHEGKLVAKILIDLQHGISWEKCFGATYF